MKSSVDEESVVSNYVKKKNVKTAIRFKKNRLILMTLTEKANRNFHQEFKNQNQAVEQTMFAYKFRDQTPIYLTGEILLQPKDGVSIDRIIQFCDNEAEIVRKTKYNTYKLEVKNWDNLLMISNNIYESGLVKYCHPNFVSEIVRYQEDPLYVEQYYLNNTGQLGGTQGIDINAPEAWQLSMGVLITRVAVIDDGVENHEDFNGRVLQGFTPTNATGFGAPTNNLPPEDLYIFGHGEACAGIIASTHNNIGIAGIAPSTQIVPVNIFNNWFIHTDSYGVRSVRFNETAEDLATAIDWAWDEGNADVLSNSWGYRTTSIVSDEIVQAINRARTQGRNTLGSVVVFASGNNHQSFSGVTFPANVNGVVTVGAIDNSGDLWNYSSRGAEMDLVVPSGDVNLSGNLRTTDRMGDDGYDLGNYMTNFGGTSAACPQVAGVVALMLSTNGNLTETEVVNVLRNTATDMGSSGFDNSFGYGRLNAFRAIQEILPTIIGYDLVCSSGSTYSLNLPPGTSVTWTSSSNISFPSGNTGGTVTAKAYSSTSSGAGWIEARISNGGGEVTLPRKDVWVGSPSGSEILCRQRLVGLHSIIEADALSPGATYYNWSVDGGSIQYAQNTSHVVVATGSTCLTNLCLRVSGENACGSGIYAYKYIPMDCSGPPSPLNSFNPDPLIVSKVGLSEEGNSKQLADTQMNLESTKVITSIAIFPNPVEDVVNIQIPGNLIVDNNFSIEIYNSTGKLLLRKELVSNTNSIDLSNSPSGTYIVKLITDQEIITKKIIKK